MFNYLNAWHSWLVDNFNFQLIGTIMILPLAFIFGVIIGIYNAKKRNGNKLDKLQYGVAYGIAFLLLALILTIVSRRLGFI
jgi:hypothetical protein